MQSVFPQQAEAIIGDFVEMSVFDALVGNNDRHPANWGVIEPISLNSAKPPRFSPIFDTARGLFWNLSEKRIVSILGNDAQLEAYLRRSTPQIGWDGSGDPQTFNHFDLMRCIARECPQWMPLLEKVSALDLISQWEAMIEEEFRKLLSTPRRQLIVRCLKWRQQQIRSALSGREGR